MKKRFLAYLIDVAVQVGLVGIGALLLEMQSYLGLLACGALLFASCWLYFALMESSKYQATLGKLAVGIKVVDIAGERISFYRASCRHFAKLFSRLFFGLGFVMMLFSSKKQCLHDKLASTLILQK
ncbi:MAG: RDD family protein [Chlamydiales bacterium]|nr:RDD family protein [Chlamydiales bacterium]